MCPEDVGEDDSTFRVGTTEVLPSRGKEVVDAVDGGVRCLRWNLRICSGEPSGFLDCGITEVYLVELSMDCVGTQELRSL